LQKSPLWRERHFEPTAGKKQGIYPNITQMNADEEFLNRRQRRKPRKKLCSLCVLLFKRVFRICVNVRGLRATPNSGVAGRAWPFAPFRGHPFDTSIITGAAMAPPCRAVPIPRGWLLPPPIPLNYSFNHAGKNIPTLIICQ
jgi:hypothetical protein